MRKFGLNVPPPAILLVVLVFSAYAASGDGLDDVANFREYGPLLSSAGQPTAEQLLAASELGYERVIDLSFNGGNKGIEQEDAVVIDSGMRFIQLPVNWRQPAPADFRTFAAVMQAEPEARTLVHCQLNYRASAFSFLYRVAVLGEDVDAAEADMLEIWTPNSTWSEFITDSLAEYDIDYACEACDADRN